MFSSSQHVWAHRGGPSWCHPRPSSPSSCVVLLRKGPHIISSSYSHSTHTFITSTHQFSCHSLLFIPSRLYTEELHTHSLCVCVYICICLLTRHASLYMCIYTHIERETERDLQCSAVQFVSDITSHHHHHHCFDVRTFFVSSSRQNNTQLTQSALQHTQAIP